MRLIPKLIREVMKNIVRKPATLQYPKVATKVAKGFRGKLEWIADKCIGCGLCAMDCPSGAIELIPINVSTTEKPEYRRLPVFHYYRCIFCYQCVESCPTKAILPSTVYDLSSYDKENLIRKPSDEEKSIILKKFKKGGGKK
ncbi:MAG: NADH-quinone oxidoreductase subunit I [Thermoprotei archaeon]|nr:MAG: NADH-quinone oxidoreductase subunit I [Thermoprotei archaeon]RLF21052.1 MAG: NADH-quinone oxidoreductase subunit I [Thermoprotei archaeon]